MKVVISSTYDSKYLWYLPLTVWGWHKLGVETICFLPYLNTSVENKRIDLINDTFRELGIKPRYVGFASPEHKTPTYAQCARLYAGSLFDIQGEEALIVSDADMLPLNKDYFNQFEDGNTHVVGVDLVPEGQYPMCYLVAPLNYWWKMFDCHRGYQKCLDDLLGDIECESFIGNYWGKDQETAFQVFSDYATPELHNRSNGVTQTATRRYDRDDAYILDRLSPDTIDYHMNRPGYEGKNFEIILTVLKYHYPNEDFQWFINYNNAYKELL